jgi:predicted hydrocarbon binding protein
MKGVVFDILRDMVETQYGLEGWQAVLDGAGSDGIYVSTKTYADTELMGLVATASEITTIPVNTLVFSFGEYMVPHFYKRFPYLFSDVPNFIKFLMSVDQIIHVEVRKLFPDAGLPTFDYCDENEDSLTMIYKSPRKLCQLAEGLISGSAKHFNQNYKMTHNPCMHTGSDYCALKVELLDSELDN